MCAKQYHAKTCQYCGKEYVHWSGKSKYCSGPHYAVCEVCGKKFEFDISKGRIPSCCSKVCTSEKRRATCVERYGAEVASQSKDVRKKLSNSGKNSIAKRTKTCLQRYGVENAAQCDEVRLKMSSSLKSSNSRDKYKSTSLSKYGTEHPMQSKQVFDKHAKASKKAAACDGTRLDSEWERIVYDFLTRNNISFERQVPLTYKDSSDVEHVTYIDFCVDGILIEVKGEHLLHGVFDYASVPIDDKLNVYRKHHVVVATSSSCASMFGKPNSLESNGLKYLNKCPYPLIGVDIDLFSDAAEFPYRDDRPEQFYDVKVGGHISSKDAFSDESIRWKMILNRILYSGGFIDGKQVLAAMNVTRTCKQPSWFSKSFAKSVISNYVTSDVVVDPFAGWGTRYDACLELGKLYVGCDINEKLVEWHRSKGRDIQVGDAKTFSYNKPCSVFICPPYQDVEVYVENQDCQLTQCQWLSIVMANVPSASEYVMVCKVVDKGWEQYIVNSKVNKSHFGVNTEYVLCVPGKAANNFKLNASDIDVLRKQANLFNSSKRVKRLSSEGRKGNKKAWITNPATGETKMVSTDLVKDMENLGWVRGRGNKLHMQDYVWINNSVQNKRVPKHDVSLYLDAGWTAGRTANSSNHVVYVHKDSKCVGINPSELDSYMSKGWEKGNGTTKKGIHKGAACGPKGKICINNGEVHKYVQALELKSYLSSGWVRGRI